MSALYQLVFFSFSAVARLMMCKNRVVIFSLLNILLFVFLFSKNVLAASNVTVNATVPNRCGNAVVEGAEQCDDGNLVNNDGCSNSCLLGVEGGGG